MKEGTYYPSRYRKQEIPKGSGKVRVLSIPTIKDRIVQTALKLILEPIFEADFQDGSYGYRPGRKPGEAIKRIDIAILQNKTKVLDLDIRSFFDDVRHHHLLGKIAKRTNDSDILRLVKRILKANGRKGIPQGSPISPLFANIYFNDIDKHLEKIKVVGNSKECFKYIQSWVLKKVRRHMMRARNGWGYGWNRWSTNWIYQTFNLYRDYEIRYV